MLTVSLKIPLEYSNSLRKMLAPDLCTYVHTYVDQKFSECAGAIGPQFTVRI